MICLPLIHRIINLVKNQRPDSHHHHTWNSKSASQELHDSTSNDSTEQRWEAAGTELVPAWYAEGGDLHGRGDNQRRLRGVTHGVLLVHEAAGDDGLVLGDHLIAVAALEPLLVLVALVVAVLHLKEVPDHAVFPNGCDQVSFLLPILRNLRDNQMLSAIQMIQMQQM